MSEVIEPVSNQPMHDKRNIYTELRAGMEKEKQDMEQEKRDKSFVKYAGYGPEYQKVNAERAASSKIKIDKFGPATIIASINVDPQTGKSINGHDYNPEAQSHKDIELEYQKWLLETLPDQRIIIFEGDRRPDSVLQNRDQSIRRATESGLIQLYAKKDSITSESGEASMDDQKAYAEAHGIPKEEFEFYIIIRNLTNDISGPLPKDISLNIYGVAALRGVEGFKLLSDDEKIQIKDNPEELNKLRKQASEYANTLNEGLKQLELPNFRIGTDNDPDTVRFDSNEDRITLAESWNPSNQTGRLAEIQRVVTACRDKHLFELIAEETAKGKKPFVVYGGSHVVSLEPVLQEYYGKMETS